MWFWWFMLICDLIVPIVMIIGGRMMWKHCPKSINGIVGYRTNRSMEKYGYMEVCSQILRKALVENRMVNDYTICFDTYSVIP